MKVFSLCYKNDSWQNVLLKNVPTAHGQLRNNEAYFYVWYFDIFRQDVSHSQHIKINVDREEWLRLKLLYYIPLIQQISIYSLNIYD